MDDIEADLADFIGSFSDDPLGFVLAAFPWGEPGTDLATQAGPDEWQIARLKEMGERLKALHHLPPSDWMPMLMATASGHGIGKSALICWVILWAMSTFPDTRGLVTANTEPQLRTKTWPELAKWYGLLICRHWFTRTKTSIFSADPKHADTWRIDAIPWSQHNPEAFAGLHNEGKRILVVFDEASAIADIIWETVMGALTDQGTQIIMVAFSNPTQNTGYFRSLFGKRRGSWSTAQIDSRSVRITNKGLLNRWVEEEGIDSDFVRVRVLGQFPSASSSQFIPSSLVEAAAIREVGEDSISPLIMTADTARFGDDETVIAFRRGRDARSIPWVYMRQMDTVLIANKMAELILAYRPAAVFIDEGGPTGAGVIDILRSARHKVTGVNFGSAASTSQFGNESMKVANKRAEMWASMRAWLKGGAIPADQKLHDDLVGPEYTIELKSQAVQLERKQRMKERGLASPDRADALALSFAFPVAPKHRTIEEARGRTAADYDPFSAVEAR
jgi:hypothetical protein